MSLRWISRGDVSRDATLPKKYSCCSASRIHTRHERSIVAETGVVGLAIGDELDEVEEPLGVIGSGALRGELEELLLPGTLRVEVTLRCEYACVRETGCDVRAADEG